MDVKCGGEGWEEECEEEGGEEGCEEECEEEREEGATGDVGMRSAAQRL